MNRRYITRDDDMRRVGTDNHYLGRAIQRAEYFQGWANRLRRR